MRTADLIQRFKLVFLLSIFALGCSGANRRTSGDGISEVYNPPINSVEGNHELLNAVIYHINHDYMTALESRTMLRNGIQYYAKNYATGLTLTLNTGHWDISCNGKATKEPVPANEIEELGILEYHIAPCLSAAAKTQFKVYKLALASALLAALPVPGEFFTRERTTELQMEMRGNFASVGLEIKKDGARCIIVRPLADGPAAEAGIPNNSLLNKIDGESTSTMQLGDIVRKLRGVPGSRISIEVQGDAKNAASVKTYELARRTITIQPVETAILPEKILYLRVKQLSVGAGKIVRDAAAAAPADTVGVIIDLRNSPGGLVSGIKEVTDPFIKEGIIFETRGRRTELNKKYTAEPEVFFDGKPIIVLTDEGTAAGSEMVAIALQIAAKAKIYGRSTRGQSEVSNIIALMYGTSMQLPIQELYRADGKSMRVAPVKPDVEIAPGEDALKAAVRVFSQQK